MGMGFGRQIQPDHSVWERKEWNLSTDWRRSDQHLPRSHLRPLHASQLDGAMDDLGSSSSDEAIIDEDDDNGPEWVGGWKDLHL